MLFKKKNKISKVWKQLINHYNAVYPGYSKNLNKGIQRGEFEQLEDELGFKLPIDMKELYEINNGDSGQRIAGSILGLNFLSIYKILKEWNQCQTTLQSLRETDLENLNSTSVSVIPNTIKNNYLNSKWIPIADDNGGNYIGIDMDPDTEGKIGQVINFGRDEDKKIVIAEDLYSFIKTMIEVVRSKEFELKDFEGEKVFVLDNHWHAIDYFKSKYNL